MQQPVTDEQIERFVALIQERSDAEFAREYPRSNPPTFEIDPKGKRYARIIQCEAHLEHSGSAHCFVDYTDGAIYYPAGYRGPQKNHARGNVNSESHGAEAIDGRGRIRMLR
jgi:hypothetical protein